MLRFPLDSDIPVELSSPPTVRVGENLEGEFPLRRRSRSEVAGVPDSIITGDCLEVLRTFPDDQVNLVVTSPPYADSRSKVYDGVKPEEFASQFLPIPQKLTQS